MRKPKNAGGCTIISSFASSALPLLLLLLLASPGYCQSWTCANTPTDCVSPSCVYSDLSSLIQNTTNTSSYTFLLCINLTSEQSLTILSANTSTSLAGALFLNASSILIQNSLIMSDSSGTSNNYSLITAESVDIVGQSQILMDSLNISATTITLENSTVQTTGGVVFIGEETVGIQDGSLVFGSAVFVTAGQAVNVSGSTLTSRLANRCNSQCSCVDENTAECGQVIVDFPRAWNQTLFALPQLDDPMTSTVMQEYMSSFDITLNASQITLQTANLSASGIAMVSNTISLDNTSVNTAGQGCQGSRGLGCGYYDITLSQLLGCTGTGGSYGGRGGSSSPDTCALLAPRQTYGSIRNPTLKGSGGGTFQQTSSSISSGGGIIFVQTQNLTVLSESMLLADGSPGILSSGGGSGGSINIELAVLTGNLSLSARGGQGKSSGGGGRIALKFMMWRSSDFVVVNSQTVQNLNVSVDPGPAANSPSGLKGSFYTTPCLPGYELNGVCRPCLSGTFKTTFGYQNCTQCLGPANSTFEGKPTGQNSLSNCANYNCSSGYIMDSRNQMCITKLDKILNEVGGQNVVISICMVIGSLIIYGIFVLITKILKKKDAHIYPAPTTQDNLKQFAQKPIFQIQQLPYHEFRIYLSGSNNPKDPWHLKKEALKDINIVIIRSLKFEEFIEQVNVLGQYKLWQKALIYFLRVYYFPLAAYVLEKLKEGKAKQLSKIVKKFQKDLPNWEETTIKLNVKSNNSVACLEIFNYHRSLYDFYLENCFPLVFVLQKRPMGGYMLDFSDPFLKAMIVYRDQKFKDDPDYGSFEKYCQQLNQLLLKIPNTDPLLSHLASADQFGLQMYLMQPPDNILNFYPKERFNSKLQLILVVVEENTVCRHFVTSSPLPNFKCLEMDRLKWQLSRREEQKPSIIGVSWLRPTKTRKIVYIWVTGVFSVLLLINQIIIFYDVIVFLSDPFIYVYFILLPLVEFMNCVTLFGWCLKPSFKIGMYSVLFTLANLLKSVILGIVQVILLITPDLNTEAGFFILGNIVLLFLIVYFERPFLWTCRNL